MAGDLFLEQETEISRYIVMFEHLRAAALRPDDSRRRRERPVEPEGGADMSIPDLSRARWRTSSHSSGNGACVQVTTTPAGVMAVRDSKDPAGPRLLFSQQTWKTFTSREKNGAISRS